jgi:aminocarboxymuconate-semialdehyde decarboxylase
MGAALHGCGERPFTKRSQPGRRRDRGRPVVDLHCHVLHPATEALAASLPGKPAPPAAGAALSATLAHNAELMARVYHPKLTDIGERLADMDAMGVDIQAISPSPTQYHYWAGEEGSEALVLGQNEAIAEICASHPDRFVGLGNVSLQHPKLAAAQVRDGVQRLGLRGFEVSSTVNGQSVEDEQFAPFWREVEALGAVVLLHPLGTTVGPRLDEHYLSNVIGQPLETTVALSRMILGGHFDRFPALKLCAAHGGGYLPLYAERMAHAWKVRPESCSCQQPPTSYLRQIYFDTVIYEPEHLQRLVDAVGASQLVIGTDYPFDMGHDDPVGLVEACDSLSDAEKAAILGANALVLLGMASSTNGHEA